MVMVIVAQTLSFSLQYHTYSSSSLFVHVRRASAALWFFTPISLREYMALHRVALQFQIGRGKGKRRETRRKRIEYGGRAILSIITTNLSLGSDCLRTCILSSHGIDIISGEPIKIYSSYGKDLLTIRLFYFHPLSFFPLPFPRLFRIAAPIAS